MWVGFEFLALGTFLLDGFSNQELKISYGNAII